MNNLISIDYYKGAYGPTIRIDLPSEEVLLLLKDILRRLACGSISEYKLHELPSVRITGLHEFYLKLIPKQRTKSVRIAESEKRFISYWLNSSEGWEDCLGLLDGFSADTSGHQYLSEEGIDDALIVVSYLESGKE